MISQQRDLDLPPLLQQEYQVGKEFKIHDFIVYDLIPNKKDMIVILAADYLICHQIA